MVGAGAALDAATPRPDRRAAGAARLGRRHQQPLVAAGARRPAVPGAVRVRAGPRGAGGARAAARAAGPAPGAPGAVHPAADPWLGAAVPGRGRRAVRRAVAHLPQRRPAQGAPAPVPPRRCSGSRPGLSTEQITGAIGFYDAQIDDAGTPWRSCARPQPAACSPLSGLEVTGAPARRGPGRRRERRRPRERAAGAGAGPGRGRRRRCVVATQVSGWLDRPAPAAVVPSIGVHLVVPRAALDLGTAVIARTPTSVLFMLPWGEHWLVGTTDTEWTGDRDDPRASRGGRRLPARPGQQVAGATARPRRRGGRLRRPAAAGRSARRRAGRDREAVPRAPGRPAGARAGHA